MDRLDIIHDNVKSIQSTVSRIEDRVGEIDKRLAVVEDRATRRSAFIAAITGFLAGLLGR